LGGENYGPFTLFRGGKAEDYIQVSREHEPAALLPRKVATIYRVGHKNDLDATKRNIKSGGNRIAIPRSSST